VDESVKIYSLSAVPVRCYEPIIHYNFFFSLFTRCGQ